MGLIKPDQEFLYLSHDVESRNATLNIMFIGFIRTDVDFTCKMSFALVDISVLL